MSSRSFYSYLLRLFFQAIITLFLIRLFFAFYHADALQAVSAADLSLSFLLGTGMDAAVISTTLFFLAFPLFLAEMISGKNPAKLFFHLANIMLCLIFFLNILDPFFYDQYGTRMNLMMLRAADSIDIILPMIWKTYPVLKVLFAYLLLCILFIRLHSRSFKKIVPGERSVKWGMASIATLVFFSFIYYGPPFWTLTSFSGSSAANQMSSNGAYTFIKAFDMERQFHRDLAGYEFGDTGTALNTFRQHITRENEESLSDYYPTLRKFRNTGGKSSKKNVVIIIMESFSASRIGVLGGKKISPAFDRYSRQGVLFTSCFSSGVRTQHGVTAILSGFPPLLGSSLIRRKGISDFSTIGNCMQHAGYRTSFFHNGRATYDDMDLFLRQGGFSSISDIGDYREWTFKNEWGVADEDLYKKAYPAIWSSDGKPSFTVLLTMSNHGPYEIPRGFAAAHPEIADMHIRDQAFYYSDHALGVFLDSCSRHPEFKNTLFLITADHGEIYEESDRGFKFFHIPALLLNSSQPASRFTSTCSQIDLPMAVLAETGYALPFHLAGQNPFDPGYLPFSFSKDYESMITLCRDSIAMQWDIRTETPRFYRIDSSKHLSPALHLKKETTSGMMRFAKDYLQSISYIYRYGRYKLF